VGTAAAPFATRFRSHGLEWTLGPQIAVEILGEFAERGAVSGGDGEGLRGETVGGVIPRGKE